MPTFEYTCNQCEKRFEKLLRKTDQSVDCPHCQSADLTKLFSSFSHSSGGAAEQDFCPPGGCGACPNPGFCAN